MVAPSITSALHIFLRPYRKRFAMTGFIRFHRGPLGVSHLAASNAAARNGVNLDSLFNQVASEIFGDSAASPATGSLRADVRETASAYVVTLDVPGIAKEDITVDVDEKSVRVEATVKTAAIEGEKVHVSERASGNLSRAFRLSQPVDADAANAVHEHGVLTLTLPKKNAALQKRLAIN
jgi:HSP20 family protein